MSSRLVLAPDRVNASFAASRMRMRLRCASVRGFRWTDRELLAAIKIFATGDILRLSYLVFRRHSPRFIPKRGCSSIAAKRVQKFEIDWCREEDDGGSIWSDLNHSKMFYPGLICTANGFWLPGLRVGLGVETARALGSPWRPSCGCGARFKQGGSSNCASAKGCQ